MEPEDVGEVYKRTVRCTLQGTNVDNLFCTVDAAAVALDGDFAALLQLVPCSVFVEVEWMVVWSFVH